MVVNGRFLPFFLLTLFYSRDNIIYFVFKQFNDCCYWMADVSDFFFLYFLSRKNKHYYNIKKRKLLLYAIFNIYIRTKTIHSGCQQFVNYRHTLPYILYSFGEPLMMMMIMMMMKLIQSHVYSESTNTPMSKGQNKLTYDRIRKKVIMTV